MDMMGPMQMESIAAKSYIYVCVDDFSRFSWINFLRDKLEAFKAFEELWVRLSKQYNHRVLKITRIRSDHGKEFERCILYPFIFH